MRILIILHFKRCWLKDSAHQKNLHSTATELFKPKTGMLPELMNNIFYFSERPYNLRSNYTLEKKQDYTVYHGSKKL